MTNKGFFVSEIVSRGSLREGFLACQCRKSRLHDVQRFRKRFLASLLLVFRFRSVLLLRIDGPILRMGTLHCYCTCRFPQVHQIGRDHESKYRGIQVRRRRLGIP